MNKITEKVHSVIEGFSTSPAPKPLTSHWLRIHLCWDTVSLGNVQPWCHWATEINQSGIQTWSIIFICEISLCENMPFQMTHSGKKRKRTFQRLFWAFVGGECPRCKNTRKQEKQVGPLAVAAESLCWDSSSWRWVGQLVKLEMTLGD